MAPGSAGLVKILFILHGVAASHSLRGSTAERAESAVDSERLFAAPKAFLLAKFDTCERSCYEGAILEVSSSLHN